ncbi:MAG: zinc-dependent metalloprotease family protein [Candidatus Bathyarchaeia archaeon]
MKVRLSLLAIVLILTFVLAVKADSSVKVAVYLESTNINESERANIIKALEDVRMRFYNQLGKTVEFEIVGTWESSKNTDRSTVLLEEAIMKTDGIYANEYSNCDAKIWIFRKEGYTVAVYITDQDLDGQSSSGYAHVGRRACIVDYYVNCWYPMECLKSTIQHELSHLFGLEHCDEEWCVMNSNEDGDGYTPREYWFLWWKIDEKWATQWGSDCKQTLLQIYDGCVLFRKKEDYRMGMYASGCAWTEEYYRWNLVHSTLIAVYYVNLPSYRPLSLPLFGDPYGHPVVTLNSYVKTYD